MIDLLIILVSMFILVIISIYVYFKVSDARFEKKVKSFEITYASLHMNYKEAKGKLLLLRTNVEQIKLHIDSLTEKMKYMPIQLKNKHNEELEMLKADYMYYLKELEDFKVKYEDIEHNYYELYNEYLESH